MMCLCVASLCSVFFEKEAYFCKPSELMERETGGVSVVTGIKVGSLVRSRLL